MKPRLIHPVDVVIERLDQAATTWDPDFREPVANTTVKYKEPETIKGQVNFRGFEQRDMTPGGETPVTSGHIVYRTDQTISLQKGDRIVSSGGTPLLHVYVTSVKPAGTYGGKHHLEKAEFQERRQG